MFIKLVPVFGLNNWHDMFIVSSVFMLASLAVLKPLIEDAMLARSDQIVSWTDESGTQLLFRYIICICAAILH